MTLFGNPRPVEAPELAHFAPAEVGPVEAEDAAAFELALLEETALEPASQGPESPEGTDPSEPGVEAEVGVPNTLSLALAEQIQRWLAATPKNEARAQAPAETPPIPTLSPKLERAARQLAEYLMALPNKRPPETIADQDAQRFPMSAADRAVPLAVGPDHEPQRGALPEPDAAPDQAALATKANLNNASQLALRPTPASSPNAPVVTIPVQPAAGALPPAAQRLDGPNFDPHTSAPAQRTNVDGNGAPSPPIDLPPDPTGGRLDLGADPMMTATAARPRATSAGVDHTDGAQVPSGKLLQHHAGREVDEVGAPTTPRLNAPLPSPTGPVGLRTPSRSSELDDAAQIAPGGAGHVLSDAEPRLPLGAPGATPSQGLSAHEDPDSRSPRHPVESPEPRSWSTASTEEAWSAQERRGPAAGQRASEATTPAAFPPSPGFSSGAAREFAQTPSSGRMEPAAPSPGPATSASAPFSAPSTLASAVDEPGPSPTAAAPALAPRAGANLRSTPEGASSSLAPRDPPAAPSLASAPERSPAASAPPAEMSRTAEAPDPTSSRATRLPLDVATRVSSRPQLERAPRSTAEARSAPTALPKDLGSWGNVEPGTPVPSSLSLGPWTTVEPGPRSEGGPLNLVPLEASQLPAAKPIVEASSAPRAPAPRPDDHQSSVEPTPQTGPAAPASSLDRAAEAPSAERLTRETLLERGPATASPSAPAQNAGSVPNFLAPRPIPLDRAPAETTLTEGGPRLMAAAPASGLEVSRTDTRPDPKLADRPSPENEAKATDAFEAGNPEASGRWSEEAPAATPTAAPLRATPTTREVPEALERLNAPLQVDLQPRPLEQQAAAARAPEAQVASQMRRLLAEVDRAVEARPHLQPLRLRFENEDGTPMRLLVSPGPGGQHKITVVVAHPQLRDELKRALPELSSAVSELPLDVSEIDITVDEVGPPRRSYYHHSRPNLGGPG